LRGEIHQRIDLSVMPGKSKSSWHNTAMTLLVLASLAMFGTIAYIITLQDITNSAISYITGLLISVTGILLGLSGLTPASKSLERMKLQVTLTITTLLWLVAVVMIAQTAGPFTFASSSVTLRYLFLVGIALFTVLVVMYSTSTIEATRQRLMAEQVAKSSQPGKATG
jgi:uncharacterized membrane protein YgdD (TMEM256/DUF423 family)